MITKIQQGLLDLMKELDSFLTQYDIPYYLGGGSFIGAMRHGGFLPWDDDLDIHMTRDNADRFFSLRDKLPENRIILREEDYPGSTLTIWRYMDISKSTIARTYTINEVPSGRYIDIMLLEALPEDESEVALSEELYDIYRELKIPTYVLNRNLSPDRVAKYLEFDEAVKKIGYSCVYKDLEEKMFRKDMENAEQVMVKSFTTFIIPKYMWGTPQRVKFEDTSFLVAEHPEELLTYTYGERWLDLPPPSGREVHYLVEDSVLPYTYYFNEIFKTRDNKKARDFLIEKKRLYMNELITDTNFVNVYHKRMDEPVVMEKIRHIIEEKEYDIDSLAETRNIKALSEIFSSYYKLQFMDYKFYDLFFDMPDHYIYAAMIPLLFEGDYMKVIKVLSLYEREKGEIGTEKKALYSLKELTEKLSEITKTVFVFHDYERAREYVDECLVDWEWLIILLRADMYLQMKDPEHNIRDCEEKIRGYLSMYPRDGELLKYFADIMLEKDDKETAVRYYKIAAATCRNGLIVKDIKDKMGII